MWTTFQTILLAMSVTVTPPRKNYDGVVVEGTESYRGEYTISLLGLPIARSTFESVFAGNKFTIRGKVSSAGLAKIFDSTTGTSTVNGRFVGKETRADSFRVQYKSGKKTQTTAMSFRGGAVTTTENVPPLRKRDNWVAVKPGQLKSVTDPISATLIRANTPAEVCSRNLRMFDGEMRMNLKLSPSSTGPVPGYDGDAITCTATFVPVAGYRTTNRSIHYLRDRAKIAISFAQLGDLGVYAPVRATVSTTIGTVTVTVKRNKL